MDKQTENTEQLGSAKFPIVHDPAGFSEGICFHCRHAGVLFFVQFHDVNGLYIHARLSKGKKLIPIKAEQDGAGIIVTVK